MKGDTFTSLSFLDQILSAEFLSKNFQTLEVKIRLIILSSLSLIKIRLGGVKDEQLIFLLS